MACLSAKGQTTSQPHLLRLLVQQLLDHRPVGAENSWANLSRSGCKRSRPPSTRCPRCLVPPAARWCGFVPPGPLHLGPPLPGGDGCACHFQHPPGGGRLRSVIPSSRHPGARRSMSRPSISMLTMCRGLPGHSYRTPCPGPSAHLKEMDRKIRRQAHQSLQARGFSNWLISAGLLAAVDAIAVWV